MSATNFNIVGFDLNGPRGSYAYAVVNQNNRVIDHGLVKAEEWEKILHAHSPLMIGCTTPISLNTGKMRDPQFRANLTPAPAGSRYANIRVAEYELITRGFPSPRTPTEFDACATITQRSLRFTSALAMQGYLPTHHQSSVKALFEINPEAWFTNLLGVKLLNASSLEGRIQRQLALQALNLNVPDAMEFFEEVTRHKILHSQLPGNLIFTLPELNALAAATTGWALLTSPQRLVRFGENDEGFLYLPQPRDPSPSVDI